MKVIYSWRQPKMKTPSRKKIKLLIKRIVQLADLKLPDSGTLSIIFPGPRTMQKINNSFLDHNYLTDVICFNYELDSEVEDEVAVELFISPDIAAIRSKENKKFSYSSELVLYLIHGILHAAGMKDKTDRQRGKMRKREAEIMEKIKTEFTFTEVFPE